MIPRRFIAKRAARTLHAQVWDDVRKEWVANTAAPLFHEVASMAERFNRLGKVA